MDLTNNKEEKYLYKYLPFNQYSLQLLINQKFYLSSPDLLNDPFEGDFEIANYSELNNERIFEFLLNERKKNANSWIDNNIKKRILEDWRLKERDFELYLYEYLNNSIRSKFGTTSFSKKCDIIDMWSHYADSHKGFILIFNRVLLSNQNNILNYLVDVEYDSMPKIAVNPQNLTIINDSILLKNKLKEWDKEKEVRIIKKYCQESGYENEYSRMLDFPLESIIGVIYGLKMSSENLMTIDNLMTKLSLVNIKSYFAKKSPERDKVIFQEFSAFS